jgi:two-component system, NarL family, response regulator
VTIRILVADDHPIVRAGTIAVIANESDMTVVAEAANGTEAVALYDSHLPDVALIDLRMPVMDGISAMVAILGAHPEARLVALTTYDGDADIYRALDSGACGYLIKDLLGRELVEAIRAAASGKRVIPAAVAGKLAEFTPRVDLTAREVEVLHFAAKGMRNKEIARVIGRTEGTVKVHLKHLMSKLGVDDRTEAVTLGLQRGIIHLDC